MAEQRTWVEEVADDVVDFVARRGKAPTEPIVCASGISPSGPVHLGNLRELVVAHAVAEELAARGRAVRHLHFWDDYDRFRRVPATVPASFDEFLGRPLSAVPDPAGDCHPTYAEHFIDECDRALGQLQIRPEQIRQSAAYAQGTYIEDVRTAVAAHAEISAVLARFQTRQPAEPSTADSEADDARRPLPVRIYCEGCGQDHALVDEGAEPDTIAYRCEGCGHTGTLALSAPIPGKLVWKVDWPMRWAHYGVDFEPGGVDHSSPGSSYEVGTELVRSVFGSIAPHYVGYSFVGIEGRSKLSGSHGDVPTPGTALRVLEPSILRWQYIRRRPRNSFTISFGSEVLRLYDEWDSLQARVASGHAKPADTVFSRMALRTTAGDVATAAVPVPFRILAAAADVTQGNREQLFRVVREHTGRDLGDGQLAHDLEPRLSCAVEWALAFQPDDERTRVRDEPASPGEVEVTDDEARGVGLLLDELDDHWSLEGLTTRVYGIPKLLAGLTVDAPADDDLKRSQREFFAVLYRLLTHADTGPRLPTLLLSLGRDRVRTLLEPWRLTQASPG